MIPSVLTSQLRRGIEDYLRTTFQISTPLFHRIVDDLLDEEKGVFQGPYLSVALPFISSGMGRDFFECLQMRYQPHLHQEKAFKRIIGPSAKSTIVATGTGSGKTECFLYPLLEYCYKNRNVQGIKAIIIYPMNALATDQAKRFAREIWQSEKLRNKVNVGLYVGDKDKTNKKRSQVMSEDWVIDNRETLRKMPPDILLTNYKMLDYMLVRPHDASLWKENNPETLKYIVVDELHTFDGAQGTDLACLLRRLKHRLKTPEGHLCCIGTSATLGGGDLAEKLVSYAAEVFGENFTEDSVITEARQSDKEFLESSQILNMDIPGPEALEKIDPENYDSQQEYVSEQYRLWFNGDIKPEEFTSKDWRLDLCQKLKSHLFFQNFVRVLGKTVRGYPQILDGLKKVTKELEKADDRYAQLLLDSLLSLVSEARRAPPDKNGKADLLPFLDVRLQLWSRELTRMVCECSRVPHLRFSDDLTDDQVDRCLPLVNCRDCGATGWLGILRNNDDEVKNNLQEIYRTYFSFDPKTAFLFPFNDDGSQVLWPGYIQKLCGNCLHLMDSEKTTECQWCGSKDTIRIFRPDTRRNRKSGVRSDHICPFCGGTNTLAILGARSASITSVVVSQIFASLYNDDKKMLAFSDSVQDASHRAGFFSARTYRFNFRGALQKYIEKEGRGKAIPEVISGFQNYWKNQLGTEKYLATFIAPNMTWLEDFEYFIEHGKLPENSNVQSLVDKRIGWEILSEYGFNARIGRTLEKTGCSIAYVNPNMLKECISGLLPVLENEIGDLRGLKRSDLEHILYGIVINMKNQGGVFHEALNPYIESFGNIFRLGQRLKGNYSYMPWFAVNSRAPRFLTNKTSGRFDILESQDRQRTTWHQAWVEKYLLGYSVLIRSVLGDIFKPLLNGLEHATIVEKRSFNEFDIWGLRANALMVSDSVAYFKCSDCGHTVSGESMEEPVISGMFCLRMTCHGRYQKVPADRNYYASLYKRGDIQRIFSEEHTGLLERTERDRIEKQFINPEERPCSPNLLSCTPTLELGINIGDLSTAVLCSVPPKQANYLQRLGRVGRHDGNGMTITIAGSRPHDLYFFAEPLEMISGEVSPPGIFLSAPAVLKRQLTAFGFDSWIGTNISSSAIPGRIGDVLNGFDNKANDAFPYNFVSYIETKSSEIFDNFVKLFPGKLNENDISALRTFFLGGENTEESMVYGLVNGLSFLAKQRTGFQKRIRVIREKIKKVQDDPARDKTFEKTEQDLKCERDALLALVNSMNERETFRWLTDEGLLPNYAFPESGVTLKSVIYKRKKDPGTEGSAYHTWAYEFDRPAVAAIRELAPANEFYAGHRKVEIDQVDLSLSGMETWRFCNSCSHMKKVIGEENEKSCPKCGSSLWSDEGQKRRLIKLKQVFATTEDSASRIGDDSEERNPVFYNRQLLVNFEDKDITQAYKLDCPDLPFGFEFLKKACLREINFGRIGTNGESVTIAGVEMERSGFTVCKHCGKIQRDHKAIDHSFSCPARNQQSQENLAELLYLYREYTSEAIRILLPTTTFSQSNEVLHSFIASLQLGLKLQFKGGVDHLQTCLHEEPLPGSVFRKRYLVLYDTVPGGTGYLQQLMTSHEKMVEVLQKALEVMEKCVCRNDPQKDGCYRCLYAYRNSFDMRSISRSVAVDLLSNIIKHRDKFVKIDNLKSVQVNALFDSELEARFVEALRKSHRADRPVILKKELVNKKPGYFLKIKEVVWFIEPQVALAENEGVSIRVSVDFMFWPGRESATAIKPIAVFTDGFTFHKDRIGLDCAQRMAILNSGKYQVWSFSWKDIESKFSLKTDWYEEYLPYKTTSDEQTTYKFFDHYMRNIAQNDLEMRKLHQNDCFSWFVSFLGNPDEKMWSTYAFMTGLLYKKVGSPLVDKETILSFIKQLPSSIVPQLNNDQDINLIGYYCNAENQQSHGKVEIFSLIDKNSVNDGEYDKMTVVILLDDTASSAERFEPVWSGFLRLANLFQFLSNGFYFSRTGQTANMYNGVHHLEQNGAAKGVINIFAGEKEWNDIFEIAGDEAKVVLIEMKKRDLTLPMVGFELSGENGEIIATAELAWEKAKIALLTEGENQFAELFKKQGWNVGLLSEPEACIRIFTI